jgi:DNA polymerase-4
MARTILHADMDAFYASIEQRDDPALRGRPVIVAGLGKRGVVSTASYEARKFGVRSAMPTAEALRRCPDGVFLPPRMQAYAAVSAIVQEVFGRYSPLVEPLSLDEAFLDLTGSEGLFGPGAEVGRRIQEDVRAATSLTVSVGVASCKFVAKVASDLRKPGGLVVVPAGEEAAFLAPLPLSRLWGAGKASEERLARLGLRTIGDVAACPRATLVRAVGAAAAEHFQSLARGDDPRDVVPDRDPLSIGRETTFDDDVADDDALDRVLLELCESVGRRLRAEGKRAGVVRVKVRFPPFETHARQARQPTPLDDDLALLRAARALVAKIRPPGKPVRLIGVTGAALVAESAVDGPGRQLGLFDAPEPDPGRARRLTKAVDALRDRFGDGVIRRAGGRVEPEGPT